MKLIVGLGNPGIKYKNTRHNIGFMFVDSVVDDAKVIMKLSAKLKAQIGFCEINGEKVCLCKPMTYMNLSGEAVKAVMKYYNISIEDILVIHDDLDLSTGRIRIRERGSCGGHNGMRSIIEQLGSSEIKRIRIGIDKKDNVIDYVLSRFTKDEMENISKDLIIAPLIIKDYIGQSFSNLMNKYNTNE